MSIKAKNAWFLKLRYTYRNVFLISAVWISSQNRTSNYFMFLLSICILMSSANVPYSSTQLEKTSDQSKWLKGFVLVLDLDINEARSNCIKKRRAQCLLRYNLCFIEFLIQNRKVLKQCFNDGAMETSITPFRP